MHELQGNKGAPLSVFISYAHEDEPWRQRLEAHLSLLRRQGLIADWHDRQILAGDEWARAIDQHLETASIILLLISPDFLASDYCYDIEMQHALERHKRDEARVIPVILRPCDWRTSPFARLQCLPRDGKAVMTWQNPDEAFLTIAQGLRRVIEQQPIPARPLAQEERQYRTQLMKRMRATWIEGVLEHSLHQAALITLDLQEQPDALANPWQLEVQETNLPPRPLPTGTSIVQVYDEAEGELLILGEPGAGKTTLLLELARSLLERAEKDEHEQLPVVFNLSSWAQGRRPLAEWLVEELSTKYQVPRKVGKAWIDSDQILPLLDGLDEVADDTRPACIQAIMIYRQRRLQELGATPLVVCCRSEEYEALPTHVTLQQAVTIQPLTDVQIEAYLQSTKGQIEGLGKALYDDPELYELARRPLMLNLFTLTYQGAGREELPAEGTREAQQRHVFAAYAERMLTRRGISKRTSREQALRWLTFLATQMQQHYQTVFYLEHMQPDWLADRGRWLLYQLSVGLVGGLVGGLIGGLQSVLVVGLLFGLLLGLQRQIRPGEILTWSWRGASRLTIGGLLLVVVSVVQLFHGLPSILLFVPVSGLIVVLVVVLLLGRGFALSTNQLDDRLRLRPNQGIWRSVRNGLLGGLLGVPLSVLVFVLALGLFVGPLGGVQLFGQLFGRPFALLVGLPYVLPYVLLVGLGSGLGAFLQHFTLRFWLWRTRHLPWNMVAFLDEAAERLLLRKVGGGYIFIHRLLLDYFASLEKKES